MIILPDPNLDESSRIAANVIALPQGIIGFPRHTRAELLFMPEHYPFLWMRLRGGSETVNFVVIEPGGVVPEYELELFDADAKALDISESSEAAVFNIVTLRPDAPLDATVNLIGPIIVNRRTRVGRQLVIANHSRYSARHRLIIENPETARATA